MESAGRRNQRVVFQQRVAGPDEGTGNVLQGWADVYGPVWARIRPINGREEVLAQRLTGVQPVEITIVRTPTALAIGSSWRAVNVRTRETFGIVDARNADERNAELAFLGVKGPADG